LEVVQGEKNPIQKGAGGVAQGVVLSSSQYRKKISSDGMFNDGCNSRMRSCMSSLPSASLHGNQFLWMTKYLSQVQFVHSYKHFPEFTSSYSKHEPLA
jgi:hypothetical protein